MVDNNQGRIKDEWCTLSLMDGLTYNLRGYFANYAIFEKGSNKQIALAYYT